MNPSIFIAYLSMLISVSTFIYGFISSKYFSKELKYLLLLVFISVCSDILSYVYAAKHWNNFSIVNIYSILEVLLYFKIYSFYFKQKTAKTILFGAVFIVSLITGIECFIGGFFEKSSTALMVNSAISIMLLSILWFYRVFQNAKDVNILKEPFFWINSSSLVYFSSSLFIFLFSNYIFSIDHFNLLWPVHNVLHIIYFLLISIGFWKQRGQQK